MNALRRIHAALVSGGLVIDAQPVSPRPVVRAGAAELGTLDMRGWLDIVEAVDERVAETIEAGLFAIDGEHRYVVTDTFDSGAALVEVVSKWQGTVVPAAIGERLGRHGTRALVDQEVRLRLLRAL